MILDNPKWDRNKTTSVTDGVSEVSVVTGSERALVGTTASKLYGFSYDLFEGVDRSKSL